MGKDLKGKEIGKGLRQKPDGMYSGRYYDRFGKRHELYNRNLAELKKQLKTAKFDDEHGNTVAECGMILSKWFQIWLDIHKYKVIRNNTVSHYKMIFKKHIEPVMGKKKLKDITQLEIKMLLKTLDEQRAGFETKNRVKIMLSDMFDKAMIDNYVLKNPCKGVRIIRDEKKDMRVLTREEQTEFFDCCKGTFYDNLFVVAISTGLRQGELCALTWDDIDLTKKEITVNKTLLYQKLDGDTQKTFHLNPPKTKTSNRIIPINKSCEIALKKQFIQKNNIMSKHSAKPYKGFEDLLFTTKFGTPLCDQILIDAIKKIIDELNLCRDEMEQFEMFSPHCFRHTFATRCFEANITPKTVQEYLGHSTLQMTMDLYTHVLSGQKKDDMVKLECVLENVFGNADNMAEEKYNKAKNRENLIVDLGVKRGYA